jgi:hypothetical protein
MTPFGTRLRDKIDIEILRMQNEWFFKWHFIKEQQGVEIDSFDGRMIRYGGIRYYGSAHQVYWATLKRYLALRLGEYFDLAVDALERFPPNISTEIADEFDQLLKSFCSQIATIAAEKDRILRGNGTEFPEIDNGRREELVRSFNIQDKTNSLKEFFDARQLSNDLSVKVKMQPIQLVALNDEVLLLELKHSLQKLINALSTSNSIGKDEPNEKAQHVAEIKAAKELLEAPQVEKKSFGMLIGRALKWCTEKAVGTAIAETVKAVVTAVLKNGL